MLRLEIPDDLLLRAVSDAIGRQLEGVKNLTGYVDMKGACKFLSVGETQFKEWMKLGLIHPRKISSHLVRFHLGELTDFMEEFKLNGSSRHSRPSKLLPMPLSSQDRHHAQPDPAAVDKNED